MAWHILHGLLEQVRVQSTFPGKLWIIVMFIFRIIVVSRIGDMVYEDEQEHFICNTLTPGCTNVCFNRFSPISQLRYWSLMVLFVSTPSILFFLYAMHIIYHADVKFPVEDTSEKPKLTPHVSENGYLHPPSLKRRRDSESITNGNAPPLYEVTKLDKPARTKDLRKRRHRSNREDGVNSTTGSKKGSNTDNNASMPEEYVTEYRGKHPIYNPRTRRIEYMKDARLADAERDAIRERKLQKKMLQHPELHRAYWWHVFMRLILEVAFIVGQYYLYGLEVYELYECPYWPCPKTVDCFVSRPREKTCLLWLMYLLGIIAAFLSLCEFWTLGLKGTKIAFMCCCMNEETPEQKRKRLAKLESHSHGKETHGHDEHAKPLTRAVSLDSLSSESTVWSV